MNRNELPEPDPDFPDCGRPERRDWSGVVFTIAVGIGGLVALLAGRLP